MQRQNRNNQEGTPNSKMSPSEEKKWMQNFAAKNKARLYLNWRNRKGNDCKMIGPETKCFCDHRFKEHDYLQTATKKVGCKNKKCACNNFYYIPTHGAYDFKCLCKHSYKQHDPLTRKCTRNGCTCSNRFSSTWTCSCGMQFSDHFTVVETFEERRASGREVGEIGRMIQDLEQPQVQGGLLRGATEVVRRPQRSENTKKGERSLSQRNLQKDKNSLAKSPPKQMSAQMSPVDQGRRKQQLQKLNSRLQKELQDEDFMNGEEIAQQIEEPEIQGDEPAFGLYARPHNYRRVTVDMRKLKK